MDFLGPTIFLYLLAGVAVAVAVYVTDSQRPDTERLFEVATAIPFWPLYVPMLLTSNRSGRERLAKAAPAPPDEMASAINQVDAELDAALDSLDGWAEDVLAREEEPIEELRAAWKAQSERIREMDRLLAQPEYRAEPAGASSTAVTTLPLSSLAAERLRHSQQVRRQNVERLKQVRQRAYEDLMGTLAWVRELVSMIHLAKFTGAPASRAEELVAQIAAAVEGISELTWQDETRAGVGDNT
jgi:hypothetical protein